MSSIIKFVTWVKIERVLFKFRWTRLMGKLGLLNVCKRCKCRKAIWTDDYVWSTKKELCNTCLDSWYF